MNRATVAPQHSQVAPLGPEQSGPPFGDAERERLIKAYRVALELEPNQALKRIAWGRMAALIGERSPAQIAKMERERGFR